MTINRNMVDAGQALMEWKVLDRSPFSDHWSSGQVKGGQTGRVIDNVGRMEWNGPWHHILILFFLHFWNNGVCSMNMRVEFGQFQLGFVPQKAGKSILTNKTCLQIANCNSSANSKLPIFLLLDPSRFINGCSHSLSSSQSELPTWICSFAFAFALV